MFRLTGIGEVEITREDEYFYFLEQISPKIGKKVSSDDSVDVYELPWNLYYDMESFVNQWRKTKFQRLMDILRDIVWDFANPYRRRRQKRK